MPTIICPPSDKDANFIFELRRINIPCSYHAEIDQLIGYNCIIHVSKDNFERAFRLKESYGIQVSIVIVEDTQFLR